MKIDGITVNLYDEKTDEVGEVILYYDSGDDIYPTDMKIDEDGEIQKQILQIRKIAFGD